MALTECFECKKSISSAAPACIHCGAPMVQGQPVTSTGQTSTISFGHLPRDERVPEPAAKVEPNTEISPAAHRRRSAPQNPPAADVWPRPVEVWLKIMVFLLPMVFVWFLLRRGHSLTQRLIGFGWLGLMILLSKL